MQSMQSKSMFPDHVLTAYPLFLRSYSRRKADDTRETWAENAERTSQGFQKVGGLTSEQTAQIKERQLSLKALPSGRWLWVGGTPFIENPKNYPAAYNCCGLLFDSYEVFSQNQDYLMQGTGVGTIIEKEITDTLPPITTTLHVTVETEPGGPVRSPEFTQVIEKSAGEFHIIVGDSREGWVTGNAALRNLAITQTYPVTTVKVFLDGIRAAGQPIKGFGGVTNPELLGETYVKTAQVLNQALGRPLSTVEIALILGLDAKLTVAGNVRRSARWNGFSEDDIEALECKQNLWTQDEDDNWIIDPERDALRYANHSVIFKRKPTLNEIENLVSQNYYSGEGAIWYAPEAMARSNADLWETKAEKSALINAMIEGRERTFVDELMLKRLGYQDEEELEHRIKRYGANPCLAAGTLVLTKDGYYPVESLVNQPAEVWDGETWQTTTFHVTGRNQQISKLTLHSGEEIYATPYHTFILANGQRVELRDLEPGDSLLSHEVTVEGTIQTKGAYLKGFLLGDGTNSQGYALLNLYPPKYGCIERLLSSAQELDVREPASVGKGQFEVKRELEFRPETSGTRYLSGLSARPELIDWVTTYRKKLPHEIYNWDTQSKAEFIAGLFDADGTAADTSNGYMYQLSSIEVNFLKDVQLLLKTLGVASHFSLMRKGGTKDFGPTRGGVYPTKACYRLTLSQTAATKLSQIVKFERLKSFATRKPKYLIKPRWANVKSVEFDHIAPEVYCCTVPSNHSFGLANLLMNGNCSEILGVNFTCNLGEVHLNQHDPEDLEDQILSFKTVGLSIATLLNHKFDNPKMQKSRELDPIVGASFTGLFDFFVNAFGVSWLHWWMADRDLDWDATSSDDYIKLNRLADLFNLPLVDETGDPYPCGYLYKSIEAAYFNMWRETAENAVWEYCDEHGLKRPNRCTTCQPAGSKSLLTGASPGWHPPKAQRYIRRMTFGPYDPVAMACLDMGYSVVPGQKDTDEDGKLLTDPHDPRVTEWLVEIPVEVPWANLTGVEDIDIEKLPAKSQFDFWMHVQAHYTQHATSATIEFRQEEIPVLAECIYNTIQADGGYVSTALLARFDDKETYPRLPFEPISRETYQQMLKDVESRRVASSFEDAINIHDQGPEQAPQDVACSGVKCELNFAFDKPKS